MGFKITFDNADSAINAMKFFNLRQQTLISVLSGNFKLARSQQKEFAKAALDDFETYKKLPNKITYDNLPFLPSLFVFFKTLKYSIFYAFSKKTPEEKEFTQKAKEYLKTLTPAEKKAKTIKVSDLMKENGIII